MKTVTTEQYEASREAYWNAQREFRAIAERSIASLLPIGNSAILDISDTPRLTLYRVLDANGDEVEDFENYAPDIWERIDSIAADMEAFSWDEADSFLASNGDGTFIIRQEDFA